MEPQVTLGLSSENAFTAVLLFALFIQKGKEEEESELACVSPNNFPSRPVDGAARNMNFALIATRSRPSREPHEQTEDSHLMPPYHCPS